MTKLFFVILFALLLSNITFANSDQQQFSLLSYNVENLFDTEHDQGKDDWSYLPVAFKKKSNELKNFCKSVSRNFQDECLNLNWDSATLRKKIINMGQVIKNYNNGKGADIIVLTEVENIKVLKMLVDIGLPNLGYQSVVLIEGPDKRGIDIGMISRFPVVDQKLHPIDLNGPQTRGILEVTFKVGKKNVTIFGNHWPSQSPSNNDYMRLKAAEVLYDAAIKVKNSAVIAVGDFNTLSDDAPHGINEVLLNSTNRSEYFIDAEAELWHESERSHPGTHWYKGSWSSLDRIFVLQKTPTAINPTLKSFTYNIPPFAVGNYNWVNYDTGAVTVYHDVPLRFDPKSGKGYSDHLGIAAEVSI